MLGEDALGPTFAEFFRTSDFGAADQTKDILGIFNIGSGINHSSSTT